MVDEEVALDPDMPIIDPHLHQWEIMAVPGLPQEPQRFLLHETLDCIARSGHNITHSVFVECHAMHRAEGPAEMRAVGETEFANGVAAMSASGAYGPRRIAHRIVGTADLTLGARVEPVLAAHLAVAGERFRGIRMNTAFSESGLFGYPCDPAIRHIMTGDAFRAGARVLAGLGLSLDIWCMHGQLAEVIALADAVPDLEIVLDHLGTPEATGIWAGLIEDLARRPNVGIKLGGLGMDLTRGIGAATGPGRSEVLAEAWRLYVEAAIAAFTPARAMFESNFPPDRMTASYGATWNAFKRIAAQYSASEKDDLFRKTAARTYRIALT